MFGGFFVPFGVCGISLCKICYALGICCPGGVVLPLCAIVVWFLVGVATDIGTFCDGLCAPFVFFGIGSLIDYGLD